MILLGGLCLQSEMLNLVSSASDTEPVEDWECAIAKTFGRELWIPMMRFRNMMNLLNPPTETTPAETTTQSRYKRPENQPYIVWGPY